MAATTPLQFRLQIPLYKKVRTQVLILQKHQVHHRKTPFSPQLRNLSISAIPTSSQACNFSVKPFETLKQNPRVLTCRALSANEPNESPSAPRAYPYLALAASTVVSVVIVRVIRTLAEKYIFSIPNPNGGLGSLISASSSLCLAYINPDAVDDRVKNPLSVVASGLAKWLEIYSTIIWIRVLLSWFPNITWDEQPLSAIRDLCDPYLNVFRSMIPPLMGMLDVSPLLAFIILGIFSTILRSAASQ